MGLTFLVPAYPGRPGKRAVKQVSVCLNVPNMKGNYADFSSFA